MTEVSIQCPNCGGKLYKAPVNSYWCADCNTNFKEEEIRKRCGI